MRVFITGATGNIGNAVACAFRRAGHHVFGLARSEESARLLRRQEICPVLGDLSQPETYLKSAEQAEILVHCASDYASDRVAKDAKVIDTFLQAADSSSHVRAILYTSGVWIYGSSSQMAAESTPVNPISLVAWRPEHDHRVLSGATHTLRTVVFRPGFVYGGSGGLLSFLFAGAKEKGAVPVIERGQNHWAMIHRDDLAQAYVLAAESSVTGVVLNLTDGSHPTIREMARAVCASAGIPEKIVEIPYKEALALYGPSAEGLFIDQKVSNLRAKQLLNWTPRHPSFLEDASLYYQAWLNASST
jgi:nucleoside-diphosphate-sugar epimerase